MQWHDLKIWPKYFKSFKEGNKPYEIRRDDRSFKQGDILVLREWKPADREYTGKLELARVLQVDPLDIPDCPPDLCYLAVERVYLVTTGDKQEEDPHGS